MIGTWVRSRFSERRASGGDRPSVVRASQQAITPESETGHLRIIDFIRVAFDLPPSLSGYGVGYNTLIFHATISEYIMVLGDYTATE